MSWALAYQHDRHGKAIAGDIRDLIDAIEGGATVRVRLDYADECPAVFRNAISLWVRDGQVYAQLAIVVSCAFQSDFFGDTATVNTAYEPTGLRFLDAPYWYFEIVSTQGDTDKSRWSIADAKLRRRNQGKYAMKWFVNR